jgi:GPH family glycoside/pentoside/hexuronide:cation symporter
MTQNPPPASLPPAPAKNENTPAPRIGAGRVLAFGAGGILDNFGTHGIKQAATPVYNLIYGVNPAVIGVIVAVTRVWDAFTNPVMGSITDNARTRWGRRRPFILAGAVGSALLFPLLWWIPGGFGQAASCAWILALTLLFYAVFTVFTVPYRALGFEYSPDYHGKTRLMAVRTVFTSICGFGVQWFFPVTQFGWFGSPETSVIWVSIILAVAMGATAVLPALFCKERAEAPAPAAARREKIPLFTAMRATLKCRPFRLILVIVVLMVFGTNLINALGMYVNIYYVHGGEKRAASIIMGWSGTAYHAVVICTMPLLVRLSRRVGKKAALLGCLGAMFVASVGKWFLFTPAHPWWQLAVSAMMGLGGSGLWMLVESMVADVCEWEEARSGRSMAGMFGAMYGWVLKAGLALCVGLSGFMLVATGFDVDIGPVQHPSTLLWMRILFTFTTAAAIVLTVFLVIRFPLNAAKMAEVRATLDARRAGR